MSGFGEAYHKRINPILAFTRREDVMGQVPALVTLLIYYVHRETETQRILPPCVLLLFCLKINLRNLCKKNSVPPFLCVQKNENAGRFLRSHENNLTPSEEMMGQVPDPETLLIYYVHRDAETQRILSPCVLLLFCLKNESVKSV